MFETNKIADVMTQRALRVRPGHYIDTNDMENNTYHLWVRHGKNFICMDLDDPHYNCSACRGPCKKIKLNEEQKKSVPKLIRLLNLGSNR